MHLGNNSMCWSFDRGDRHRILFILFFPTRLRPPIVLFLFAEATSLGTGRGIRK